ncbi:MAG: MBL fold metallo-hydrolase [Deltaproteobacteria bacterium]|nr:MBL fold metallo-hydrolase [Deltaproteobacteria bacterium]
MAARILSNLWQVGGPGFTSPRDAAVYLMCFGGKAVLIDAGCGGAHESLKVNIDKFLDPNVEVKYLLLTHCHFDHTGGAEAIREEYGCRIVCHVLDAVYLEGGDSEVTAATWYGSRMPPLHIDIKIEKDRRTIQMEEGRITAHHWPGHSPGSLVYTTQMDGQTVLFGQDVHGPLDPSLLSDQVAYQASLKKLLSLNADILCEGHFGIYRGKETVRKFIGSFQKIKR